jgi:hypothetical protein
MLVAADADACFKAACVQLPILAAESGVHTGMAALDVNNRSVVPLHGIVFLAKEPQVDVLVAAIPEMQC